jgi:thiol-disulfide isomerase/thioredoxin
VLLGVGFSGWAAIGRGGGPESTSGSSPTVGGGKLPVLAPDFATETTWVNSKPLKLADQMGKVVVVHFWTNGCINCIHNYPHYRAWTEKYKDNKGLLIVGIHSPEFEAEKDVDRIKDRAARNRLTFAIAVDNEMANWKAWGNTSWPCIYLVDKAGRVRYRWEGELGDDGYEKVTGLIDTLLSERSPKAK